MARLEKDEMEALLRRFIASCGSSRPWPHTGSTGGASST